jgi:hypothetical protein
MNRLSLLVLGILLCSTASSGQTSSSDSQTLQGLLSEIRQLRLDLQTRIIAVQRGQILIYRLQGQEAIVARASQHLDEARDKLKKIQEERENVTADFQDLSPRGFHNHSPTIFMIMHPPFSPSFTHRFHDHAPTVFTIIHPPFS